jgi:hypothetical protein
VGTALSRHPSAGRRAPAQEPERHRQTNAHASQEGAGDGQARDVENEEAEKDKRAADGYVDEHEKLDRAKHELAAGWGECPGSLMSVASAARAP